MISRLFVIAALACIAQAATPFNKHFRPLEQKAKDAVFLTPHIEAGEIELAQERSRVHLEQFEAVDSYAGYITINKT